MTQLADQLVLANVQRTIGAVLAVVIMVAFVAYALVNVRIGRAEVGAEQELAPNRGPGLDDDELETRRLDISLSLSLILMLAIGIGLPAYWLAEPGRQAGAEQAVFEKAVERGEEVYLEGAQCISCHGKEGVGGVTETAITDSDGNFVDQVNWLAPALNTVLYRYSRDELKEIVVFGRDGTPMPPWGREGGGPLNANAVDDVITYIETLQVPLDKVRADVTEGVAELCLPEEVDAGQYELPIGDGPDKRALIDPACTVEGAEFDTLGETLFNLPTDSATFACARCHTQNWSATSKLDEPPEATETGGDGRGAFGPSLGGGVTDKYTAAEQVEFVTRGGEFPGTWEMPGFGFNPNAGGDDSVLSADQFMLTATQIEAVVAYARSL